jgi:dihydrofolate reductase
MQQPGTINIYLLVAMTRDGIIGKGGRLPWNIPEEMRLFRKLTLGQTVIMGRRTFESIGRPLPDRNNIVISSTLPPLEGVHVAQNVEEALAVGTALGKHIFFIGGAQVYDRALALADYLYISWIHAPCEGDVRFPDFDADNWHLEQEEVFDDFTLCLYARVR